MTEESERVAVHTYVPAYQRDRWAEDAGEMGMNRSEFVRAMVQTGRREFGLDGAARKPVERPHEDATPRGDGLKSRVEGILREEDHLEWDELVDALTVDVEDRLDAALSELQDANRVRHSGRHGGYALVEDADGE